LPTDDQFTALPLALQPSFYDANEKGVIEHEAASNDIIPGMVDRILRGILLLLVIALTACQDASELPTLAPSVATVSVQATESPAPPTATSTPATPTATFTPSVTPVVLTPQPTPLIGTGVNITSPAADSEIALGSEIVVSGLVQTGVAQEFLVTLNSATGHILADVRPNVSEFNSWQATLVVPHSVSGWAEIRAQLVDAEGTVIAGDTLPLILRVDPDSTDRYLTMDRPYQADAAVAGYNIFFDGIAQNPVDSLVTISLWNDDCQNRVATQSFRLRGSGYWQGFVVIPLGITGQICAAAHFGEPEDESWREAQVLVDVLPSTDEKAVNVLIGNPPPDKELTPGRTLLLYGTAYNAPEREVLVSILLENGRLLTEGVAAANIYGYWELELFIPASAAGPAQIEASIGERGNDAYVQSKVPVHIGQR
jgi:hypothetical protein